MLLLVPIVLAAFAPVLAPIPEASAGWIAPPLPNRDEPLPGFQHLLEPLPLVVHDLPDAESQLVVEIYNRTRLTDNQSALEMLAAAKTAIPIPSHLQLTWNSWLEDPDDRPIPLAIVDILAEDPRNADRLSNLAVAMFMSVFTMMEGNQMFSHPVAKSIELLDQASILFPGARSPILNYVFLNSVTFIDFADPERLADLDAYLEANDQDAIAIMLATSIYLNGSISGYDQDIETLRRQAERLLAGEDPALIAFGHSLLGDLTIGYLRNGSFRAYTRADMEPFTVIHGARQALRHYDQALEYSDDPSIYAARALALSLIGDHEGAVASQERAVALNPDSVALSLDLANLHLAKPAVGDEARKAIEDAREIERRLLNRVLDDSEVLFMDIRIGTDINPFVANRPERMDIYLAPGMAGGGFTVAFDELEAESIRPHVQWGVYPTNRSLLGLWRKSEALGDLQGVDDDLTLLLAVRDRTNLENMSYFGTSDEYETSALIAALVAEPSQASRLDHEDVPQILTASQWLSYTGRHDDALSLCRTAIEKSIEPQGEASCLALSAFFAGDYDLARKAFSDEGDHFYAGYAAERDGNIDQAISHYTTVMEVENVRKYEAMLRLAGVYLQAGDSANAERYFSEWFDWIDRDNCMPEWCPVSDFLHPYAFSNRGIARLQSLTDGSDSIDCEGDAYDTCLAALTDFDAALEYDSYNPIFLMNRAWVARLLGDHEMSAELMERALESDSTLYPVLVDMGVYAAVDGDPEGARQYFLDAVAANPEYDLGWWNLGVLEMQRGPGGILKGQAYLARAIERNRSLATSSLNFKTDESIYRVEITEQDQPGAGWAFSTASSLATTTLGALGVLLFLFHAFREVVEDKIAGEVMNRTDAMRPWFNRNIQPRIARFHLIQNSALVLLVITIIVMVLVAIIPAWRGDPGTAVASITVALFALVLAVVTHEFGHRLSAKLMDADLEPVQWTPGLALALVLLPFNLSSGPFPAQQVTSKDDTNTLWVYLFGPLANLGAAAVVYIVYLNQPLPVLRVIAITQLAVMSYSLLPFEPLDGAPLSRVRPGLVGGLAGVGLVAGILFSRGVL